MGKQRDSRRQPRMTVLPGLCGGRTFIEVEDDRRLVITGCRGIRTYGEDCICLATARGQMTLYGCELEMGCLTDEGATVTGHIQRIEFEGEDNVWN